MSTHPSSAAPLTEWSRYEADLTSTGALDAAWRMRTEFTNACRASLEFGFDDSSRRVLHGARISTPRRCVIIVNHLSEPPTPGDQWHTHHFRLTRSSHFELVVGLLIESRALGFRPVLLDSRHPFSSALWPERRVLRRDPVSRSTAEVVGAYRAALAEYPVDPSEIELRIMDSPTAATPADEVGYSLGHEIGSLGLSQSDVVFLTAGVYSPYLVEPLVARLSSRNFLYCMAMGNTSDFAHSYEAVCNPLPSLAPKNGGRYVMRPTVPAEPGEKPASLVADDALLQQLAGIDRSSPVIVCSGRDIASQWDWEYAGLLAALAAQAPVAVVAIGCSQQSATDRLAFFGLTDRPISVRAVIWSEDLRTTFRTLGRWNTVFLNPRAPGNGQSVLSAASHGLPVLLFGGNDVQPWIPPRFVASDATALADLAMDLWRDGQMRFAAITEQCEHLELTRELNRSLLRCMIS